LAALVRSSADAIVGETLDGVITDWNPAAERLYGYAADEVVGKSITILSPPELPHEIDAFLNRVRRGESIEGFQTVRRTKDGRLIPVSVTISPVRDDAGRIVAASGISRDIGEAVRAQELLRRSEARFRSLVTNATDIITILDPDGIIRYESPPIARILGYGQDELVGRNAFDLVHPEDREATWAAYAEALEDARLVPTVEFRFRHADGSWRWLESTGTNLLADPDVAGFVVNSRDVTERKRAEAELRAALEAAQAANRATSQFLAMMSHELRTPMQAVLGYADLLLAGPESSLTAEQREDLEAIRRGAGRMIALVKQILDLSRLDAGRWECVAEPVDVAKAVALVRRDVAPQAAASGLGLCVELPPDLPPVRADEEGLHQVLLNLVGNAVKFTERGGVRVSARTEDDRVAITVSDTGIGISPEALPYIFDEFRQADSRLSRRHGGAGLGLAIAKKLADQMGGCIGVESQVGVGSAFTLRLPVAASPGFAPDAHPATDGQA
jgi:PAS domain S-box-containing protein